MNTKNNRSLMQGNDTNLYKALIVGPMSITSYMFNKELEPYWVMTGKL